MKSSQVRLSDIDAFANRAILPRISTLPGVAQVLIFGTQKYAVRVRANLDQLAVRGLTLQELQNAIVNANSSKPVGAIADNRQSSILDATGPINKAADYMPVIVTWQNGAPVRVSDVATAIDSVENDKVASWLNGTRAIVLGVYRQPDANTVEVVDRVKAMLPAIQAELPPGVEIDILADRAEPIRHAIADVEFTLALAGLLVIIAIYFFLRSFRATLIPAIALPISVIGTFAGMYLCGHSIDNISLLALTLAVGFVVDDAIVMLENIVRHIEAGEKPMEAAFKGSKEVGFTIISMTLSLVAVFIPVLFMGGVVGRMFNEFGLVITFAILISGIVSLTLTPMLCARLLKPIDHHEKHNFLLRSFEWSFNKVTDGYAWALRRTVAMPRLVLADHARHLRADAPSCSRRSPRASSRPRTSARSPGRRSVRTTPRSTPWWRARRALAEIIKRDPDVQSRDFDRRRRQRGQHRQFRPHVHHAARQGRAEGQRPAGDRAAAPRHRRGAWHQHLLPAGPVDQHRHDPDARPVPVRHALERSCRAARMRAADGRAHAAHSHASWTSTPTCRCGRAPPSSTSIATSPRGLACRSIRSACCSTRRSAAGRSRRSTRPTTPTR